MHLTKGAIIISRRGWAEDYGEIGQPLIGGGDNDLSVVVQTPIYFHKCNQFC